MNMITECQAKKNKKGWTVNEIFLSGSINDLTRCKQLFETEEETLKYNIDIRTEDYYTDNLKSGIQTFLHEPRKEIEKATKLLEEADRRKLNRTEHKDIDLYEQQILQLKINITEIEDLAKQLDVLFKSDIKKEHRDLLISKGQEIIDKGNEVMLDSELLKSNENVMEYYIETHRQKSLLEYLEEKVEHTMHPINHIRDVKQCKEEAKRVNKMRM